MTPLLTTDDVSRLVRLHPDTIRNRVRHGTFVAPVRIGRNLRWSPDAIEQFLAQPATPSLIDSTIPTETVSSTPMPIMLPTAEVL